ncbi:hypothetical protein BDV96DRAFT_593006 [Lophiotrema nucula]|uniref:Myb-like domain-containing protein n=1 Tax=Lophiotrema nucula TaxID=690887 RepID=A0A6A5ZSJ0_9PLEO|nr:hypothetical protein BDV96DRAFT_593006 [Lophiotrema nucula]
MSSADFLGDGVNRGSDHLDQVLHSNEVINMFHAGDADVHAATERSKKRSTSIAPSDTEAQPPKKKARAHKSPARNWSAAEDEILIQSAIHGMGWTETMSFLPGDLKKDVAGTRAQLLKKNRKIPEGLPDRYSRSNTSPDVLKKILARVLTVTQPNQHEDQDEMDRLETLTLASLTSDGMVVAAPTRRPLLQSVGTPPISIQQASILRSSSPTQSAVISKLNIKIKLAKGPFTEPPTLRRKKKVDMSPGFTVEQDEQLMRLWSFKLLDDAAIAPHFPGKSKSAIHDRRYLLTHGNMKGGKDHPAPIYEAVMREYRAYGVLQSQVGDVEAAKQLREDGLGLKEADEKPITDVEKVEG